MYQSLRQLFTFPLPQYKQASFQQTTFDRSRHLPWRHIASSPPISVYIGQSLCFPVVYREEVAGGPWLSSRWFIFQFTSECREKLAVSIQTEGRWLKLIRPGRRPEDSNVTVCLQGESLCPNQRPYIRETMHSAPVMHHQGTAYLCY